MFGKETKPEDIDIIHTFAALKGPILKTYILNFIIVSEH